MELLFKVNLKLCENGKIREKDEKEGEWHKDQGVHTQGGSYRAEKRVCVSAWGGAVIGQQLALSGGLERVMLKKTFRMTY